MREETPCTLQVADSPLPPGVGPGVREEMPCRLPVAVHVSRRLSPIPFRVSRFLPTLAAPRFTESCHAAHCRRSTAKQCCRIAEGRRRERARSANRRTLLGRRQPRRARQPRRDPDPDLHRPHRQGTHHARCAVRDRARDRHHDGDRRQLGLRLRGRRTRHAAHDREGRQAQRCRHHRAPPKPYRPRGCVPHDGGAGRNDRADDGLSAGARHGSARIPSPSPCHRILRRPS